jgi:hypothetical protein
LVLFGGIGTFQWVTREKIEKIFAAANSPPGLCARRLDATVLAAPIALLAMTIRESSCNARLSERIKIYGSGPLPGCQEQIVN